MHETRLLNALEQVNAVYTDFNKAFHRVDSRILQEKLTYMRFNNHLIKYLESKPRVNVGRDKFKEISNHDINKRYHNFYILMFAVDLKMLKIIESNKNQFLLQNHLDNLTEGCIKNKLLLKVGKCCHTSFFKIVKKIRSSYQVNDVALKYVSCVGIWLDEQL